MKWGIVFTSTNFPGPAQAAALGEAAEEAGFDCLCAPEHIVIPLEYKPLYEATASGRMEHLERQGVPDPLIWFAYVAAKTRTIKFCTGVMLLTERNPLHTAKEAATLAVLSEGRLLLGVGSGWCREEYEALGVSWPNRGKRLDEYIDVCRTLWRDPVATYKGEFVNFDRLYSDPKPPGGFVPIHIGGRSEAAARRGGRIGDGYFPAVFPTSDVPTLFPKLVKWMREGAIEAGRNPDAIELTSGGTRTAEGAKWFADLGVHRLTIAPHAKDLAGMREELKRFGGEVIDKTRDLGPPLPVQETSTLALS
jgi:probable F420-dependent oxidoreductase